MTIAHRDTEPRPADPLVAASGLAVRLGGRTVLSGIDIAVQGGEVVTLIGPNGAGKSTLVRALLGLVRPSAGRVIRRPGLSVGYLPQDLNIDPTLPMTVLRFLRLWGPTDDERIAALLEEVGFGADPARPIQDLSGGETQRVLLARALLREPDLLALDEPNQGVDLTGQAETFQVIDRLRRRRGCGVLLVSHDLSLVMARTDRVVCLNGHVCCEGHPEAVSRHPEYLSLFGPAASSMAVYQHHHDHAHDLHGEVVERDTPAG
ncbi:MAG: zinc ABC transporter ATP-binding protein ZnuC [Inquilinus sp.]|nr:zinc ABC transporter ATP-binding protein ZnuC [Inquilinus sp.]